MEMCGSKPEADVVTRSTGTGRLGFSACKVAVSCATREMSVLLVGPRFVPPEFVASYPVPAAEGREWKYVGPLNAWPITCEPMSFPLWLINCPLALCGNITCAIP